MSPRRSGHELMESLGHELQHVLEVLGSSARSTAEMYNFFEYGPGVYRVGDRFETRAAVEAGSQLAGSRAGAVAASAVQVFTRSCRLRHRRRQRQWQQAGCRQVAIIAVLGPAAPVLTAGGSEQVECQEVAATMPRIRTDDADIARAIAQAIEWSETFRRLVEAIERTDGVVWIRRGPCNGAFACLLMYLEVSGPHRLDSGRSSTIWRQTHGIVGPGAPARR